MSGRARNLPLGVLLLGLCGLAACGSGTADGTASASSQATTASLEVPAGIARAGLLLEIAHSGVRRVDVYDRTVEPPRFLSYREEIVTNGRGKFSLEPVEALTPVAPDWDSFQMLQRVREGYIFRHRDFAIRDERLFRENYVLVDLGQSIQVAGRAASRYLVEHRHGAGSYEIAVDDETGLVLQYVQLDAEGDTLSAMEYESYDPTPDLTRFRPHTPIDVPYELDETWDLAVQIHQPVHVPRLLPRGYALFRAVTVQDPTGQHWLRLTYTDGVESLFHLSEIGDPFQLAGPVTPIGPGTITPGEVMVFRMGTALAVQGTLDGRQFIGIGKVPEAELLDMIESSL